MISRLHACESWTLTAELQRRIQAMKLRCYRKILRISYKDNATNEEVRAKTQQAIGPHEDFLTIVKRRKEQRYGHVFRSSGLAKTILQGTSERGKKTRQTHVEVGRQHKAMDNFSGPVRTADLLLLLLLLLFFIAVLLEIKSNQKAIDDFAKSPWCQLG